MKDRLLYLTIGLLIGIVVMQGQMRSTSAQAGDSVTATAFRLVDANGQLRGLWTTTELGTYLTFLESDLQTRLELSCVYNKVAGIAIFDTCDVAQDNIPNPRITISCDASQRVGTYNLPGAASISINGRAKSFPYGMRKDYSTINLTASDYDNASIALQEGLGRNRLVLGNATLTNSNNDDIAKDLSTITAFDRDGTVRWSN